MNPTHLQRILDYCIGDSKVITAIANRSKNYNCTDIQISITGKSKEFFQYRVDFYYRHITGSIFNCSDFTAIVHESRKNALLDVMSIIEI